MTWDPQQGRALIDSILGATGYRPSHIVMHPKSWMAVRNELLEPVRIRRFTVGDWARCGKCGGHTRARYNGVPVHLVCSDSSQSPTPRSDARLENGVGDVAMRWE